MGETFDTDGLLAALTEAMSGGEDGVGLTSMELCQKLGKGDHAIRDALRVLANSGKLGASKKRTTRIDGAMSWSPTYYIKS